MAALPLPGSAHAQSSGVKAFFSTSAFPGDEDKTLAASMVYYGILFGLCANLFNIPALILAGDPPARILLTSTVLICALLLNLFFLKRGHIRGAGAGFLLLAWVGLAAVNATAGGVRAPGFSIHIVFIICVGFIFAKRWAFAAAALSGSLGAVFVSLENNGLLPPLQVHNTPARFWLIYTANFFIVAAILTLTVNRLRHSIAAGRQELLVRQEAERELARHQATLEESVRDRTVALAQTNATLLKEVQERRLAEEALRKEKDFIGLLMEASPVGIMTSDDAGRFTFANAAAARVLGLPREQIAGQNCATAAWGFTDYDGAPVAPAELPFLRPVRNAPLAIESRSGNRRLLSVNSLPLGESEGRPGGCVITVEDVTERVHFEQEFFRAQKLESVGVLAGGIAHDFNNLLTGIMGGISLARAELPAGCQAAETLGTAEKASLQARELTQQLLTFSRGGKPIKQTLSLKELLADVTQFALRGANVRAESTAAPDLWTIEADKGQTAQIFHNLIINASESMPQGGTVRIEATNHTVGPGNDTPLPAGRYVRVTVADDGAGIPPENLTKIFDPFFSTKRGGTGLGLAVVYSVVKNHGGHIDVVSCVGKGTTFRVYLPAAAGAAPLAEQPDLPAHGRGRILLMDDEPLVRQIVGRMLAASGYEVETAVEGSAAIALYAEALAAGTPFDAVILDLTVPGGMGGAQTIVQLRSIDPNVRAIVSSGYSNDPVMSDYRAHGFSGVVAKPFQTAELSRTLRQVLSPGGETDQHS